MENIINNEEVKAEINDIVVDEVVNKGFVMNKYAKGGLVLAVVAAGAAIAKLVYDKHTEKKALRQPDKEIEVSDEDVAEITAE